MPIKVPTKASGITFYQDDEPANPSPSDWWYKPSTGELWVLSLAGYWIEVVSKYTDPYGRAYLHGTVTGETTGVSTISVVQFSADASPSALTSSFAPNNGEGLGLCASEAGYRCGGSLNGWANTQANTVDSIARFVFANHTTTNNVAHLTQPKQNTYNGQAVSSQAGYVFGGTLGDNTEIDEIEKYVFSQDTSNASVVSHLPGNSSRCGGFTSTTAGYCLYGSAISKLLFSSDTANASSVANLSVSKTMYGSYNSTLYGYVAGGYVSGSDITSIERYTFSTDTTNTHTIDATLPIPCRWPNSTMSSRKGYSLGAQATSAVMGHVFAVDFQSTIHISDLPVSGLEAPSCTLTTSVNNGYLF